jgi:RNA polymerase sigma-70 factor (ECF subfamily)
MTLKEVQRAVARLPEEQRSVLMLVCVEGLSYKEASDAIGVPAGTIMSRLARARKALKEMLGEDEAGGLSIARA